MNLSNLFEKFELISTEVPGSFNNRYQVRVWIENRPILSPYWEAPASQLNPYSVASAVEMLREWYDREVAPRLPKPLNNVLRADYSKPLPAPRPFLMLGKPKKFKQVYVPVDEPAAEQPKPAVPPKEPRSRKFDFSI